MKRLLLSTLFALALASSALAGNPYTAMGNANYTATNSDIRIVPTVAISANTTRVITLPYAGGTAVGSGTAYPGGYASGLASDRFEVVDALGNVGGSNGIIQIVAQAGDLLNGVAGGSVYLTNPFSRVALRPAGGLGWVVDSNEVQTTGVCPGTDTTIGSVANVVGTWTAATPTLGLFTAAGSVTTGACPLRLSGGSQSTGVSTATTYWIIPASVNVAAGTFALASTPANALAGTALAITGSAGSGQTVTYGQPVATNTPITVMAVAVGPGEWDCRAESYRNIVSATANLTMISATMTTSGTAAAPTTTTVASGQTGFYTTTAGVITNATLAVGPEVIAGPWRLSTTTATNVFVSATDLFSAGTQAALGNLTCRRAL